MNGFTYYTPTKVVFGLGAEEQVGRLVREQKCSKVLIHYGSGSVNARKGPATGYGVLTIVHAGERYAHIATARNGWHCIAIGDGTAWVSNKYAEVVDVEQ